SLPGLRTYVWGRAIKIGASPFWGRGVFVLVISNINIGYQKSLTLPLNAVDAVLPDIATKKNKKSKEINHK
ncbi:MAG: hypothetical protein ACRCVN_01145, partial [Spirochaetia bacterium]